MLMPGQIDRILQAVFSSFSVEDNAEISMELNPGTVDLNKMRSLRAAGINRLSIGVQSQHDEELRLLGRIHDSLQAKNTFLNARKAGFDNINIDLMSALPGQTFESWADTLARTCEWKPEHISAYSLIVEEGTPFYKLYEEDKLNLPSEETERQMYYRTGELLMAAGFERYEISNYAKKGYSCRHNERYWIREDYLGLGLGASSMVNNVRFKNTEWLDEYLLENKYMEKQEVQNLSRSECMEEFMFLGLRMTGGVSKDDFIEKFGCSMDEIYGSVLKRLEEQGLLETEGKQVRLTTYGLDVSNRVWVEFLF